MGHIFAFLLSMLSNQEFLSISNFESERVFCWASRCFKTRVWVCADPHAGGVCTVLDTTLLPEQAAACPGQERSGASEVVAPAELLRVFAMQLFAF